VPFLSVLLWLFTENAYLQCSVYHVLLTQQVLSSSWDGRPFDHNRHGPKIGGCVPSWGGELGPI